jgi:hypothetical protein
MKYTKHIVILLIVTAMLISCKQDTPTKNPEPGPETTASKNFGQDIAFLKEHTDIIVLSDDTGNSQVAIAPAYQGRVMTSTAAGTEGDSYGFLKYDLIASDEVLEHINPYGGEDRFWLGPEGGQFSIFFAKDVPFDLEHWFTPAAIDTEAFEVVSNSANKATFQKKTQLTNYSGTVFDLTIDRDVVLLDRGAAGEKLGTKIDDAVNMVAYESVNRITNTGKDAWQKDTGLLSIWILGMFKHSPTTTIVCPYITGDQDQLGPVVNDTYFGKVPADRLVVTDKAVYFSGDGQYRSKIGLSPSRSKPMAGSYDADAGLLTIVQYTEPQGATDYVNSMWELQENPYGGDVVNSYNDGPSEPGADPFGPFYELETSSPAAALKPGESILHTHRTIHLQGTEAQLDPIAKKALGVSIEEIKAALK